MAITPVGDEARAQLPGAGLGEGVSRSDRGDGGRFELRADAAGLARPFRGSGGALTTAIATDREVLLSLPVGAENEPVGAPWCAGPAPAR